MKEPFFEELKQQPLSCAVVDTVRDAIISGRLKPGSQLVQSQLASQLGVSRAPVREAMNRLEEEGLIRTVPYKGTIVTQLSQRDVEELRSLRLVLERYAACLLIERMTNEEFAEIESTFEEMRDAADRGDVNDLDHADLAIHTRICEFSGHALLYEVWQIYATRFRRVLALRNKVNRDLQELVDMHIPLIDGLRSRNPRKIEQFYSNHGADLTVVLLKTWPDNFLNGHEHRKSSTGGSNHKNASY